MGSGELQEVECPGTGDRLRAALHPQFATEVIDMPLDRVHTHDEATGDLAVGGSFKQQAQHLALALGQRLHKRIRARRGGRKSRDLLFTTSSQRLAEMERKGAAPWLRQRQTRSTKGESDALSWSKIIISHPAFVDASGSANAPPMLCSLPNPPPMIAQTL